MTAPTHDRSRIDGFLPDHDFSASYEMSVYAPPSVVYATLLRSDFSEVWQMRLLMSVRSGRLLPRNHQQTDLRQRLQGTGFFFLAEVPGEELVIGVAGKFWRPDGGRCLDLKSDDFVAFSSFGWAKAVWNFKMSAESPQSTVLSTETRIKCFGSAAFWKFRLYWTLVKPFSGLIRKAILKQVKSAAESAFRAT